MVARFTMEISREEDGLRARMLELDDAQALFEAVDSNRDFLREWLRWVDGVRSAEA